MVIYMDQYRKAKTVNMAGMLLNTEEKLCVNGHPTSCVIAMPVEQGSSELSPELPDDFSTVDVGALYDRVYALASQI